jgi:hypothetical protein
MRDYLARWRSPYVGRRRYGRPVAPPILPPIRTCTHDLVVCACRPSSLVTQPITPEVRRG